MRVSLSLLGAAAFMVIADARVIDPLLRIIADEYQASIGSTAIIVTAYTVPYGLFQLVYRPLGDRIGKMKVMTVAMVLFALGTAACAFAPSFPMLIVLLLTGTAAAGLIPLSLAYIGDNFPYEERQTALGGYLSAIMLGQILSGSLGGIFGEYLSWRSIFLLFGVVSLGISVALWRASRLVPDKGRVQGRMSIAAAFKPYFQLMTKPTVRLIIVAVFIEGFFFSGGFAYIGAFLRDRYRLSYVAIGFMLGSFGLGGLIYSRSVRWLVHRFGEKGLITLGGWLTCACYLSMALFQNWLLFIPLNILLGLGFYMLHSTLQTKATEMFPEARGTAVALFAFGLFMGQGIGAAALGLIVDGPGYAPAFAISGIAILLLAFWLVKQMRRISSESHNSSDGV